MLKPLGESFLRNRTFARFQITSDYILITRRKLYLTMGSFGGHHRLTRWSHSATPNGTHLWLLLGYSKKPTAAPLWISCQKYESESSQEEITQDVNNWWVYMKVILGVLCIVLSGFQIFQNKSWWKYNVVCFTRFLHNTKNKKGGLSLEWKSIYLSKRKLSQS